MIKRIEDFVCDKLKDHQDRLTHTYGVVSMALELNRVFKLGLNEDKIKITCLLHDAWKYLSYEESKEVLIKYESKNMWNKIKNVPSIWHGYVGAILVKSELGIEDSDIISAIRYHSTGKVRMSMLQKVVFMSDYIEINRKGANFVTAREEVFKDFNKGLVYILKSSYEYLTNNNYEIYPDTLKILKYYEGEINE